MFGGVDLFGIAGALGVLLVGGVGLVGFGGVVVLGHAGSSFPGGSGWLDADEVGMYWVGGFGCGAAPSGGGMQVDTPKDRDYNRSWMTVR